MPNNILPLQTNETIRLVPLIYRVTPNNPVRKSATFILFRLAKNGSADFPGWRGKYHEYSVIIAT